MVYIIQQVAHKEGWAVLTPANISRFVNLVYVGNSPSTGNDSVTVNIDRPELIEV